MGDFYELFFADAEVAARDLGIALTKRGKHLGDDIPMCGVPVHAADGYLQRLIRLGHRVAVCEQLEDPAAARKRGSKAVVRRDVVRLVTPGTLTEDSLLESRAHNYLAALTRLRGSGEMALAWADISSGELAATTTGPSRLAADLARLDCREIVVPDNLADEEPLAAILAAAGMPVTPVPGAGFDSISAEHRLRALFGVSTLDAFGTFSRAETACLGGLLSYITLTQAGRLPFLRPPRRYDPSGILVMDAATRANLELTRTLAGERKGSLLSVIDMTVTAGGARLLATRLATPLSDHVAITNRLDDVSFFTGAASLRDQARECLAQSPDIERGLARLSVGRGGPRDLAAIRDGILQARQIAKLLIEYRGLDGLPKNIRSACDYLASDDSGLSAALQEALADDLPLLSRDGCFIRPGFSPDLDENRALRDETKQVIAALQQRYAEETGIKSIKIRHNNVLGYFIEVTAQNAMVLQSAERACVFIHRQTVASAVRFTTIELSSLEQRISSAADRSIAIEREILEELVRRTIELRTIIASIAEGLSVIDVNTGLALLAERQRYSRPKIDDSTAFRVRAGRHPVVEAALRGGSANSFVANDCRLSDEGRRLWLITGPNMAGKSTFLRQNALIVILAQMGSFVPADEAHIGIVDRLFSRVGAADDLARGRSTFMVEMVETAAILNQATPRSFVILDEIGRGTATFDGLSIAWATIENLHDVNQCRTLFATHYHELTALASRLNQLLNMTVKVREWHGDVVFLHEVGPGIADRSYGIQVARLAGLPAAVVARASEVLGLLEKSGQSRIHRSMADDLPLFSAARREEAPQRPPVQSELERRLAAIVPDELSPREALALLYELKTILQESARA
jgi:DNA mismatch repair protein MutS